MARKKKSVVRRRRSSSSRKSRSGRVKRFFRALVVSAVTSFSAASCVLHPQLCERIPLEPILSQIGLPGQGQVAPQVVAGGPQAQTSFAKCRQFFPGGQPPIVPAAAALRELCFDAFAVLHNGHTKTPVVVAQRLNRQILNQGRGIERTDRFYPEARLPAMERAELNDYRNSGYSRGHMAPAADMHTASAMAQSFSLANMVPQDQRHNSGAWAKIESDTRKYIMRARGDVYVFTGPVYIGQPRKIGEGKVAVPTHLYKLVYDAATGRSWAHWQANNANTTAGPPISYEELVRRTGLQLLPQR
ncbi:DNA/RNA non-specific endonuclease [Pusillimonas sp.]|uniref:DNA/RNA non-specific endonuclease n=1 Tax=Pusillimonas sp. TaxID=3040095 RepID=UPI0037CBED63